MLFIGKRSETNGVRQRTIDRKITLGSNSIKVVIFLVLAAFSIFYLSNSSQSVTNDYQISDLSQSKKDITSEKERLEVEANRLKALSLIQEKANAKGMEPVTQ